MELLQAIESRVSVRNFTDEAMPVDDLKELVRRATLAPSIANAEPWRFIAITNKGKLASMKVSVQEKYDQILADGDQETIKKVKERILSFSSFFNDAPAVIAIVNRPYEAIIDKVLADTEYNHEELNELRNFPNIQTMGAAIQNMLLSATDMGYGACWLTGPMLAKSELEDTLGIKHPDSLIAFVAVGKAVSFPKSKEKQPLNKIFELVE